MMRVFGGFRWQVYQMVAFFALLGAGTAHSQEVPLEVTPLRALSSEDPCNRCFGTLLPGAVVPHPETRWGIISDLPETFEGYGVLYSTRPVLPPNGAPQEMLTQRRAGGFDTIDAGFDLFLFHLNKSSTGSQRLVVYVRNLAAEPVTLRPRQVIKTEGIIGRVHDFESDLGARVLRRDWDRPFDRVTIPAGEGRVVAYGKNFGEAVTDGPDSSQNWNCFGYVRVKPDEESTTPSLEVSVISIPAGDRSKIEEEATRYADAGVTSTDIVSLDREPQDCALGRAVGVYPNFRWKSAPVVMDLARLTEEGTSFPMSLPEIQTPGCPEARQTHDLVLHPGYTRPDTIGNYMIEHLVMVTLINSAEQTRTADVVFGKTDADIGLAYTSTVTAPGESPPGAPEEVVKTLWAGPLQSAREKSLLENPVVLSPGEARTVHLRLLILGNSSLPFQLGVRAVGEVIAD